MSGEQGGSETGEVEGGMVEQWWWYGLGGKVVFDRGVDPVYY